MNYEELIASLWQEAERKITEINREAREEEEKIENEKNLRISTLKEDGERCSSAEIKRHAEEIISGAEKKARMMLTAGKQILSDRLFRISRLSLHRLRNQEYQRSFSTMAAELPLLSWKTVRVNPEDSEIAGRHFPGAEIITDAAVSGGMDTMSGDGKIRVINTLEKRLERAWEDIATDLLKEDYENL